MRRLSVTAVVAAGVGFAVASACQPGAALAINAPDMVGAWVCDTKTPVPGYTERMTYLVSPPRDGEMVGRLLDRGREVARHRFELNSDGDVLAHRQVDMAAPLAIERVVERNPTTLKLEGDMVGILGRQQSIARVITLEDAVLRTTATIRGAGQPIPGVTLRQVLDRTCTRSEDVEAAAREPLPLPPEPLLGEALLGTWDCVFHLPFRAPETAATWVIDRRDADTLQHTTVIDGEVTANNEWHLTPDGAVDVYRRQIVDAPPREDVAVEQLSGGVRLAGKSRSILGETEWTEVTVTLNGDALTTIANGRVMWLPMDENVVPLGRHECTRRATQAVETGDDHGQPPDRPASANTKREN